MKKSFLVSLVILIFSDHVAAEVEYNKTITTFAMNDGTSNGYFAVAEPLLKQCKFNVVMFSGTGFLSVLLAAKLAGKKISLLNYAYDSATTECTLVSFSID